MQFSTSNYNFTAPDNYDISFTVLDEKTDYLKLKIHIDFKGKIVPEETAIRWEFPCTDVFSQWSPSGWSQHCLHPDWDPIRVKSRSASYVPIICHMSISGENRSTVYSSDVKTPMEIVSGIYEETANINYRLLLFTQPISAVSEYETELVIDNRRIAYEDAIRDAVKFWHYHGYNNAPVPEYARLPMYSTWYSWHQQLDTDTLLAELKEGKKYGMESVIIDDGWQTLDNSRGYQFCGDWEPTRISDMRGFVDAVHSIGMKYMMWFSVPYMGIYSEKYKEFKDMLLNGPDEQVGVLDPRFPEVRNYLISIYERAVTEWNVDGLKLDFIDSFALSEYSKKPCPEMDYESLEDGVCALLNEAKARLIKLNPDIMIEFRQGYMGPIMCGIGNMIRVADCPADSLKNRIGSVSLRLTSGTTAVHSDMLMWHKDEKCEDAALQIINILFSVPQISVRLVGIPESHADMLRFYLSFWRENRECILDGKLRAKSPDANFSLVSTENDTTMIAVAYSENTLSISKVFEKLEFINGSGNEYMIVNNSSDSYTAQITVYDCTGRIVSSEKGSVKNGLNGFVVPRSGILEILKI